MPHKLNLGHNGTNFRYSFFFFVRTVHCNKQNHHIISSFFYFNLVRDSLSLIKVISGYEWTNWEEITESDREPNWMPVHKGNSPSGQYPYEEILFAVQTKKVMASQGIRFHVRSSVDDERGTLVNINIPSDMGKC